MILSEILQLKFPSIDFTADAIIQDDGGGPYIRKWNIQGTPKPDAATLLQWESEILIPSLVAHAEQTAATKEAALASPLDNMMRNKTLLLHGKRAKSRAMSQAETDYLDALENDPRVLASVELLDAVMAIIADIKAGLITTIAQVENDARWPVLPA